MGSWRQIFLLTIDRDIFFSFSNSKYAQHPATHTKSDKKMKFGGIARPYNNVILLVNKALKAAFDFVLFYSYFQVKICNWVNREVTVTESIQYYLVLPQNIVIILQVQITHTVLLFYYFCYCYKLHFSEMYFWGKETFIKWMNLSGWFWSKPTLFFWSSFKVFKDK